MDNDFLIGLLVSNLGIVVKAVDHRHKIMALPVVEQSFSEDQDYKTPPTSSVN